MFLFISLSAQTIKHKTYFYTVRTTKDDREATYHDYIRMKLKRNSGKEEKKTSENQKIRKRRSGLFH